MQDDNGFQTSVPFEHRNDLKFQCQGGYAHVTPILNADPYFVARSTHLCAPPAPLEDKSAAIVKDETKAKC